ncbi:hypothetical protein BW23_6165 [Burkholderia ubonensis MSMB22]|nr:hypothetical protein BW23_6165 [Burkholderia ubonensis MSMB22]
MFILTQVTPDRFHMRTAHINRQSAEPRKNRLPLFYPLEMPSDYATP